MRSIFLLSLALGLGLTLTCQAAPTTEIVVRHQAPSAQYDYPLKLLQLALKKAGPHYTLQAVNKPMLQGRALLQLAAGKDIDVAWTMTSAEREAQLTPIRIPIDKGLLGWRVFLIHQQDKAKFARVKTLTDLGTLEAGQGHDWPDTEILRANGLRVQGVPVFDQLFTMLQMRRFDYFPRSVMEVWGEERSHQGMDIAIEPTLILHYPTAFYFFVNKGNPALASAIEKGLLRAKKDGSFDQLFNQAYGDVVQRTRLSSRKVLQLRNHLLPPETPLGQKDLWLSF